MTHKLRLLGFASLIALGACSSGTIGPAERVGEASMRSAESSILRQRNQLAPQDVSPVRSVDEVFTGATARRNDRGEAIPREWERMDGFVARRSTPMQLFEIASLITEVTKLPVTFAPDVLGGAASTGATPAVAPATAATGGGPDINAVLSQMGLAGGGGSNFAGGNLAGASGGMIRPVASSRNAMRVEYAGRLSGFLNSVGSHFGVGWEYSGGEIRMFRNQTRTFTINALPAAINLTTNQSADSASSASGGAGQATAASTGTASQKLSTDVSIKIWEDITSQVNNIVGGDGRVTSSVSTGTITVTAPMSTQARVQSFMDRQNERLSKQVLVSAQVLQVDLNEGDNYSLDVQGLFSRAADYGITFGNTANLAAQLATVANPSLSFGVTNPNSRFAGTGAMVEALSTRGRVSVRQTVSLMTMNGIPAPLQVANTRGYLASVSTSDGTSATGGTGGTTTRTTLVPGQVTTGFSMSLLPRVNPSGGSLLMQFAINMSELVGPNDGFRTFSSNGSTIQLPDVNTRSFVQQAEVPNGASLVLTGFEQTRDTSERRGTGIPEFMGLGGRQVGNRGRTAIVIILTPQVMSQRVITSD